MTENVKFMNEHIRTFADDVRTMEVRLNDLVSKYGTLTVPATDDVIDDGRSDEGITQLTGNEVITLVSKAQALLAVINQDYWMDLVHKAGVRPIR